MTPESLALWVPLLPLLASAQPLLEKAFRGSEAKLSLSRGIAAAVGLVLPFIVLAVLYPAVSEGGVVRFVLGNRSPIPGIQYRLDGPSWFAASLVALVALCSGMYSLARGEHSGTFWFVFLVCVYSLQSALLAADFFHLYVCLELMALTSYILIAYKRDPAALFASFNYLALSSASIILYLFGLFLIYGAVGTLSMEDTARILETAAPRAKSSVYLGLAFLAGGLGVRTACVPFHGWLPDAHANAPHGISALLSGAMIKVSFFSQWRMLALVDVPWLRQSFLWIGTVSAVVGVVFALSQSNAKRLLAWHSVSQIGYVLAAFGAGSPLGFLAAGLHAAAHASFKSLLFLSVGASVDACGSRDAYALRGGFRRVPEAGLGFAVGALSIAAIPPFNGSVTKDLVLYAVGGGFPAMLLLAASVGTAASFAKLSLLFFSRPRVGVSAFEPSEAELRSIRSAARSVLVPLSVFCLGTGIAAPVLLPSLSRLLTPGSAVKTFAFSGEGALKSLSIAAAGTVLAVLVLSPLGRRIAHSVERIGSSVRASVLLALLGIAFLAFLGVQAGRVSLG